MRQNSLSIHSENILPIIKKWLYSSRDIFLRELVSNACDAIKKLRILQECQQASVDEKPFEIHVRVDGSQKTVTISDNGIGMTESEVEKYIAQIAFSGAEEFLAKYKSQTEKDPMIGHFGLGFYSSYMVAAKVQIQSLSFQNDAKPVCWSCDGSSSYEIGEGSRTERGTDIILYLDDASVEYADAARIRGLLNHYCAFMPEPIFLNNDPLNNQVPLWMKAPSECTDQDYIAFYRKLYPIEEDPIFWIHLNVDYPFHLQGILYFPKTSRIVNAAKTSIHLFCNRVFVSEHCRDFLPDYLSLLRGAIDSPDIPLNVSRSYLQVDSNVRQLGAHIAKKVSDRLTQLCRTERDRYVSCWPELEPLVKLGLVQDEKFHERVKDALIWQNNRKEWTTIQEYLDRAKEKKIYYSDPSCAASIQKSFIDRGVELIYTSHPIDVAVMTSLEHKKPDSTFHRIDSAIDPSMLDAVREKTVLDEEGKTAAGRLADFFRLHLPSDQIDVEAKSLASDNIAGFLLLNEEMRRMRDYLNLTQGKASNMPLKKTFVVNTNHKLVQTAANLSQSHPEIARDLARQLYDLARLAQKETQPQDIEEIVQRNQQLLEDLSLLVCQK
jgi:molecular chaperone HtpG